MDAVAVRRPCAGRVAESTPAAGRRLSGGRDLRPVQFVVHGGGLRIGRDEVRRLPAGVGVLGQDKRQVRRLFQAAPAAPGGNSAGQAVRANRGILQGAFDVLQIEPQALQNRRAGASSPTRPQSTGHAREPVRGSKERITARSVSNGDGETVRCGIRVCPATVRGEQAVGPVRPLSCRLRSACTMVQFSTPAPRQAPIREKGAWL